MADGTGARREELTARLSAVRRRIEAAAVCSGRAAEEVTLVVVTKTWPVADLRLLVDLGVGDLGENRHQECLPKVEALNDLPVRWHFVGQLQSNKASAVAGYAHAVHSLDSIRGTKRLDTGALSQGRVVECFVQVGLDCVDEDRARRGGTASGELDAVAQAVEEAQGLTLRGVMGVAPRGGDAQAAYRRLRLMSESLRTHYPHATDISAGMSGDFDKAVVEGATHVRVGSAVLGERPALR